MAVAEIQRHKPRDTLFVAMAMAHGAILLAATTYLPAAAVVVALGVWWNSNTIAHNFIHSPFFQQRRWNVLFSFYLTLLLGIPQTLWRQRHLAHHGDVPWRLKWSRILAIEVSLLAGLGTGLALGAPEFFFLAYLPGLGLGLALCALHGHHEHAGGTTSHYGALYNWIFFNDGYHVEHHRRPGLHWSQLPTLRRVDARSSPWPAVLRGIASLQPRAAVLDLLEHLALCSRQVRNLVLRAHHRALRHVLERSVVEGVAIESIAIVGGGLFPRTAILMRQFFPHARILCIDLSPASLQRAAELLRQLSVETLQESFDPKQHTGFDLVVIPLAYRGHRELFYRPGLAGRWLIHDWIWRPRGTSAVVSPWLLKRINLVESRAGEPACVR